jgi:dipeptidyl aminopeptidase/acylaminoacyl peptidase
VTQARAPCGARWQRWAVAAALWLGASAAAQAQVPPPVADFFRTPQVGEVLLSPSGRHAAMLVKRNVGRVQLVVFDLENPGEPKIAAGFNDLDIADMAWVNDDRLIFGTTDLSRPVINWRIGAGMPYAVNRDGSEERAGVPGGRVVRMLRDGSADVIIAAGSGKGTSLYRVNTLDRRVTPLTGLRPANIRNWWLDEAGAIRAATAVGENTVTLYRRDAAEDRWVVVHESDRYSAPGIQPLVYRNGELYVKARVDNEAGTTGVFRFDLAAGRLDPQALVSVKDFDFDGVLLFDHDSRRLIGIRHHTDAWATTWLDPAMQSLQDRVDAALPGLINLVYCERCLSQRRVLVSSISDRQPGMVGLFDRETGQLQLIGRSRPWIDPRRMGQRDFVRVKARDGLSIPTIVTTPPDWKTGDTPRPAVVLVHGGPYVRGSTWSWSDEAQFLASRGYVVIEPEYRGSEGFGWRHFQAGWKQWGLAMQDDVADAARWAVTQKLADGARICIAGGSYGGYSALMGLIRDPALFRCGIAWSAPTDIDEMYAMTWSDMSDAYERYGMPVLVADRQADAAQIAATSPLRLAARLKQPLLLAHGALDGRVPIEHAEQLLKALKRHNEQVEWVRYPDTGHSWFPLETEADFWGRVEQFLARHLTAVPR